MCIRDRDEAGNTTKAVTKAIAIASAVLAAIALFASYAETIGMRIGEKFLELNIAEPIIFTGLLLGGAVPFLFSSIAIRAVKRGASKIIEVVREEFRKPGVMEGTAKPDYGKVVDISTRTAQRELVSLALIGILTPLLVGFLLGELALGAFLAGAILTGQLLAVFMANSGAAWDNAKKKIEDGYYGGKGSDQHKSAVIGDTVGDPLKDTAGPALNPLIKVINLVSMLFAPAIIILRRTQPILTTGLVIVLMLILAYVVWRSGRMPAELVETEVEVKHS